MPNELFSLPNTAFGGKLSKNRWGSYDGVVRGDVVNISWKTTVYEEVECEKCQWHQMNTWCYRMNTWFFRKTDMMNLTDVTK